MIIRPVFLREDCQSFTELTGKDGKSPFQSPFQSPFRRLINLYPINGILTNIALDSLVNRDWIMRSCDFIFFDLGNVLLRFCHFKACQQIGALTGTPPQLVWKILFEDDLNQQFDLGIITAQQFYQLFVDRIRQPIADVHSFFRAYNDIFSLNHSVIPILCELIKIHPSKLGLGILSNTCQTHWDFALKNYPILGTYFSAYVLSFEEKCCKPDPRIYQKAIQHAKVEPKRIFFMDDRPENVQGAIESGIDAVVFESELQLRLDLRKRGFDV